MVALKNVALHDNYWPLTDVKQHNSFRAVPWQHYPPRFHGYNLSLFINEVGTPLRWVKDRGEIRTGQ